MIVLLKEIEFRRMKLEKDQVAYLLSLSQLPSGSLMVYDCYGYRLRMKC